MEGQISACYGCGSKQNLKKCGDCSKSETAVSVPSYCERKCQLKDWAVHKYICAKNDKVIDVGAWRIEYGDFGPLVIATRDIEAGRIVFQRKTLLTFTPDPTPPFKETGLNGAILSGRGFEVGTRKVGPRSRLPTCLSCHEVMPGGKDAQKRRDLNLNKCRVCTWPVHSNLVGTEPSPCEKAHQQECSYLSATGQTWEKAIKVRGMDAGIGLLRAWLLPEDKKKQFLDMPKLPKESAAHFLQGKNTEAIVSFVIETCGIKPEFKNELEDLMVAMVRNTIGVSASSPTKESNFIAVFEGGPTGRVLSHRCVPNCAVSLSHDKVGTFRTIRKVHAADVLTISLPGSGSFRTGVVNRTKQLALAYTNCYCTRCTTSDEDGTFLSAIRAKDSKNGEFYLPIRNEDSIDDLFTWHCPSAINKPELSETEVSNMFNTPVFLKFMTTPPNLTPQQEYERCKAMLKFLKDSALVHENHEVVLFVKSRVAVAVMNFCFLEDFKELTDCKEMLAHVADEVAIYKKFGGGWTDIYGIVVALKGFLEMWVLAYEIYETQGNLKIEDVDKRILSAVEDCEYGLKITTITSAAFPPPFNRMFVPPKMANFLRALLQEVDENYTDLSTRPGVKALRKMYGSGFMEDVKLAHAHWQKSLAAKHT